MCPRKTAQAKRESFFMQHLGVSQSAEESVVLGLPRETQNLGIVRHSQSCVLSC